MNVILSVDPGSRVSGAALWQDGKLFAAAAIKNTIEGAGPGECGNMGQIIARWAMGDNIIKITVTEIAFEWPQVYARGAGKTKADPNVNLPLAAVDGAVAALFPFAKKTHYQPHAWKGGVDKPSRVADTYAIETKVRTRLSAEELKVFEANWPKNVHHSWDLVDAVGVGLHHLGRFERHRVYARE